MKNIFSVNDITKRATNFTYKRMEEHIFRMCLVILPSRRSFSQAVLATAASASRLDRKIPILK